MLRAATGARLDNQLNRAFRHIFGAEEGLRVVVRLATREMLTEGAVRDEIRKVLTARVRACGTQIEGPARRAGGRTRADALVAMTLRWCDEARVTETP